MLPDELLLVVIPSPLTLVLVGLFVVDHTMLIEFWLIAVASMLPSAGSGGGSTTGAAGTDITI